MKVKIPFIMNGGDNKNIYNNDQLDLKFKLKNLSLLGIIDKLTNGTIMTNDNSINDNLIKASDTKEYYKKIKL